MSLEGVEPSLPLQESDSKSDVSAYSTTETNKEGKRFELLTVSPATAFKAV